MVTTPSATNFDHQVQHTLHKMLKVYRRSTQKTTNHDAENQQDRLSLHQYCQCLLKLGQKAKFPAWINLLEVLDQVMVDPHNDYQKTAGLIIKQIQHSAQLVAHGETKHLKISPKIKQLHQEIVSAVQAPSESTLPTETNNEDSSADEMLQLFGQEFLTSFDVEDNQIQEDQPVDHNSSLSREPLKPDQKSPHSAFNNDLLELFGDDFSFDESPEKETLVYSPAETSPTHHDSEISDLFGKDFGFEEADLSVIESTAFFVEPATDDHVSLDDILDNSEENAQNGLSLSFQTGSEQEFNEFLEGDFALAEEQAREEKNQELLSNLIEQTEPTSSESFNLEQIEAQDHHDDLNGFFEEDFLAENYDEKANLEGLGVSELDELSELLETSLSFGKKEISKEDQREILPQVDNFNEEDFLNQYQADELDESENHNSQRSDLDQLSELLESTSLGSINVQKATKKDEQKSLMIDSIKFEELTKKENHELSEDLELAELDDISQLLAENSELKSSGEKDQLITINQTENVNNDGFSDFFEDEFLAQHHLDDEEETNDDISNLEELSQLLESSLSFVATNQNGSQDQRISNSDIFNSFLEDEFLAQYEVQSDTSEILNTSASLDSDFSELDEISQMLSNSLSMTDSEIDVEDEISQMLSDSLSMTDSEIDVEDEISQMLSDSLLMGEEKNDAEDEISQMLIDALALEDKEAELIKSVDEDETEADFTLFDLYEEISELEALLEQPPIAEPITLNGEVKQLEKVIDSIIFISGEFYQDLSELDQFLEQPAKEILLDDLINFEALINFIDAPVSQDQATPLAPSTRTVITPPTTEAIAPSEEQTEKAKAKDDDFSDLERLLEEADLSMGGSKTIVPRQSPQQKQNIFEQNMKVPVKQLDNLNNLMGELVVNRNSLEQDQEKLRLSLDKLLEQVQNLSDVGGRMQDLYERSLLESSLLAARQGVRHGSYNSSSSDNRNNGFSNDQDYDPLEMDRFTGFHLLSAEMIELIVRVRESTSDIQFLVDETDQVARNLRQVSTQMSEGLTKTRMLPFSHTSERFSSGLYRIKRKLKKEAKLIIEGREVLIDKMIQEHLHDPMTHLINNAMTHGIETPEERKDAGKDMEGLITVRAFIQGNQTVITVSDDGAGINPAKVKAKAIEKNLITPQDAAKLSKVEIYDFLFNPGFSTKDQVGELAGRGVGLDVVRTSLNDIRGTVSIESKMGQGTTFTIRLPLTLSISKALCCLSDHARIAFPMDGVEDMQDFLPHEVQTNPQGQKFVLWRDSYLPFQSLSEFLSYNRHLSRGSVYGKQASETISIVILRSAGKLLAVQVDQVLGEQEIVIKQIQGPIPKPPGIAGATVLGDGRIMPIADVLELIDISEGNLRKDAGAHFLKQLDGKQTETGKSQPIVLIVDDSITVRELLSISFNKAGYQVEQAKNGLEAWEKLISGLPCDIIFCDVEMPQMDGLELLSNINNDERLREIPVAMLTSRGAEKHRKIAADLGASGYFTKPYLEEVLLDAAQKMIDGEVLLANSTRQVKPKVKPTDQAKTHENHNLPVHHPTVLQTSIKEKPKVLIIDDSVTVRELLSMTFKNAGYSVEQAKDGEDAWQKLNDLPDIDLAFCDIEMPRLNGLDLLARLQENERLSKLPVAMLTSRGAQKMKNIAAERGAKGYFVKPYMEEVLLDAAERLVKGEVLLKLEEEVAEV